MKATIGDLLTAIENGLLDRPVLDKTGLQGVYDIRAAPDPQDISIFTAVETQLGLKLVPQKAMVDVLVVDHVEKPSEN